MNSIKKINRTKVSDEVFQQIKENIISRNWLPGFQLPSEAKLGEMFGVSRVSIRTAVQKLAIIGLLDTRNGEGTFVSEIKVGNLLTPLLNELTYETADIVELLEFRQGVEMQSCRFAAQRRTPKELLLLKDILEKMSDFRDLRDVESYSTQDMNFHICIAEMSKNTMIIKVMHILKDFMIVHGKDINLYIGIDLGFEQHYELYTLIRDKKSEEAEELMYRKLDATINEVKKLNDQS